MNESYGKDNMRDYLLRMRSLEHENRMIKEESNRMQADYRNRIEDLMEKLAGVYSQKSQQSQVSQLTNQLIMQKEQVKQLQHNQYKNIKKIENLCKQLDEQKLRNVENRKKIFGFQQEQSKMIDELEQLKKVSLDLKKNQQQLVKNQNLQVKYIKLQHELNTAKNHNISNQRAKKKILQILRQRTYKLL